MLPSQHCADESDPAPSLDPFEAARMTSNCSHVGLVVLSVVAGAWVATAFVCAVQPRCVVSQQLAAVSFSAATPAGNVSVPEAAQVFASRSDAVEDQAPTF